MLDLISNIYTMNINTSDKYKVYFEMLRQFLILIGAEFGYVGEIFYENKIPKIFCKVLISDLKTDTYESNIDTYTNGLVFDVENKIYGLSYYTKKPYINNDLEKTLKEQNLESEFLLKNIKKYCTIPLMNNNEVIGVIGLGNIKNEFSDTFVKSN